MQIKYHWKRILGDMALLMLAIFPVALSFYTDTHQISNDLFLRCGAIMVLFSAFLEFRTHEIQIQKQEDKFKLVWATMATFVEGLAQVDKGAKIALRNQAAVIQAGGLEPAMGKPEDIKNMVVSETIKALQDLKPLPDLYY